MIGLTSGVVAGTIFAAINHHREILGLEVFVPICTIGFGGSAAWALYRAWVVDDPEKR